LANKQDQEGALDELDICDSLGLEEAVNVHKCPCRVVSCSFEFSVHTEETTEACFKKYFRQQPVDL
jgi:hypothetical protein